MSTHPSNSPASSLRHSRTASALAMLLSVWALSAAAEPPATRPTSGTTLSPIAVEAYAPADVPLRGFIARIDLTDPRVKVRAVPAGDLPPKRQQWPTTLQTVTHAAEREAFDLAVNGDFFAAEQTRDAEGALARKQYVTGKKSTPVGNAVTDGTLWAKAAKPCVMLVVSGSGNVTIQQGQEVPEGAQQVISGNRMLVADGAALMKHNEKEQRHPRTAAGLSADGKTLILVVLDGRSVASRGATLGELADVMLAAGCHTAFNLDGGGSTTLVRRDDKGTLTTLNTPSDGAERPVANLLGVRVLPK